MRLNNLQWPGTICGPRTMPRRKPAHQTTKRQRQQDGLRDQSQRTGTGRAFGSRGEETRDEEEEDWAQGRVPEGSTQRHWRTGWRRKRKSWTEQYGAYTLTTYWTEHVCAGILSRSCRSKRGVPVLWYPCAENGSKRWEQEEWETSEGLGMYLQPSSAHQES